MYNIRLTQLPPLNLSNHPYHGKHLRNHLPLCHWQPQPARGGSLIFAEAQKVALASELRRHRKSWPQIWTPSPPHDSEDHKAQMLAHKDAMSDVTTKYFPNKSMCKSSCLGLLVRSFLQLHVQAGCRMLTVLTEKSENFIKCSSCNSLLWLVNHLLNRHRLWCVVRAVATRHLTWLLSNVQQQTSCTGSGIATTVRFCWHKPRKKHMQSESIWMCSGPSLLVHAPLERLYKLFYMSFSKTIHEQFHASASAGAPKKTHGSCWKDIVSY